MKYHQIFYFILFVLLFAACTKPQQYPDIPEIEYRTLTFSDTTDQLQNRIYRGELIFHLTDGDGNIGLNNDEQAGPFHPDSFYYHNLFIELLNKENGEFVPFELAVPHYYRMPYIEPEGQNKTLKATVQVDIDYTYAASYPLPFDTIMYELFVVDRDLNHSNIIETRVVVLSDTTTWNEPDEQQTTEEPTQTIQTTNRVNE